jgi:SAM-dependent methyltransferase
MSPAFRDAKTIFNGLALEYDAYRPGYPNAAVEFLVKLGALDQTNTIADIGSGTGRLSLALAPYVRLLYAVDTADMMLDQLQENIKHAGLSNIHPIEAPGERTGLQNQSIDFVVLSQVFHWMDHAKALKEMHRILKPGHAIAILWNEVTNNADDYHVELQGLINRYNPSYKGGLDIVAQGFPKAIDDSALFSPVSISTFPFTVRYNLDAFIGYMLSKSYIGMGIATSRLPSFIQEAHEILHHDFGTGKVVEHYQTVILSATAL